jgi:hypothetical protein
MPPGTNQYDPTVAGHIPFPSFAANANFQSTESISNYNSLQTVYEHQLSAGLAVLANYTYSKCLTDERSFEGANSPPYRAERLPGVGQAADYSLCSSDTTQVVHAAGTYALPVGRNQAFLNSVNPLVDEVIGDWATNFIYSHQTGQPFSLGCPIATTADYGCFADTVPGRTSMPARTTCISG